MAIIALDRDGVINFDSPDYIKSAEEWRPIPGSIDAIKLLGEKGYQVYVATNQAGLARGLFSQSDLDAMHTKLLSLVSDVGGHIAGIMYCPHHPDEECDCRKPRPGLLQQIENHAGESMAGQCFVGDSLKDIQAAQAIQAKPVLVLTGNGVKTRQQLKPLSEAIEIYPQLLDFAIAVPASN